MPVLIPCPTQREAGLGKKIAESAQDGNHPRAR
jgi:hypothetical protein